MQEILLRKLKKRANFGDCLPLSILYMCAVTKLIHIFPKRSITIHSGSTFIHWIITKPTDFYKSVTYLIHLIETNIGVHSPRSPNNRDGGGGGGGGWYNVVMAKGIDIWIHYIINSFD